MSHRDATINDHWRHVFARTYPTRITQVEVRDLPCLSNATIELKGGIAAIVGSNGAGKSTLLAAITELLTDDPNLLESMHRLRLQGSTTNGVAFVAGIETLLKSEDGDNGSRRRAGDSFTGMCRWLDPSILAGRCIDVIIADTNFDDLLDQVAPLELREPERKIASYLVGKNYTTVSIYEISDYSGFDRFPYFRVTAGGVTYGSERMGRGELSLLSAYWTLKDMPKGSVLMLEEPETHVSPRSQDALMNIVAKCSDEMGVWVIVATHSPTVIRRIRRDNIVFLARNEGPTTVAKNASKVDISLLLGGGVAYRCALLVEDEAAKAFLVALLQILEPDMYRQCEVIAAGSKSQITSVMIAMPRTHDWLTLVGVYDGDLRTEITGVSFQWSYCFLPGDVAPDELLVTMMTGDPHLVGELAKALGKPLDIVEVALDSASGIDTHDYFRGFSESVSLDVETVYRAFCSVWVGIAENLEVAKALMDNLRQSWTVSA
jgi:energy-coupling factor transporter ATP-binding protein EcfA2